MNFCLVTTLAVIQMALFLMTVSGPKYKSAKTISNFNLNYWWLDNISVGQLARRQSQDI
jgi:hypothetical protein